MEKIREKNIDLGGAGMLGHVLLKSLYAKIFLKYLILQEKKKIELNNFECDVTNLNSLFKIIKDINPDYIINCIGVLIKGSIKIPLMQYLLMLFYLTN